MATARKAARRPARSSRPHSRKADAIALLTRDHREVKQLFQEYQQLVDHEAGDDEKAEIAQQVCAVLTVHAQIEEELFYPAARSAIREPDLVDEAMVEHASAKDLIAQLEQSAPGDPLYDAKVKVLGEYIKHHVKEEEQPGGVFAQAKRGDEDLDAMGERIKVRKEELMAQMGGRKLS